MNISDKVQRRIAEILHDMKKKLVEHKRKESNVPVDEIERAFWNHIKERAETELAFVVDRRKIKK